MVLPQLAGDVLFFSDDPLPTATLPAMKLWLRQNTYSSWLAGRIPAVEAPWLFHCFHRPSTPLQFDFCNPSRKGQFSPFFWQPFLIETCLRLFFVGDFRDIAVMIKPAKTVQISCPTRRAMGSRVYPWPVTDCWFQHITNPGEFHGETWGIFEGSRQRPQHLYHPDCFWNYPVPPHGHGFPGSMKKAMSV